jgi:hypothetical protein
MMCRVSPTHTAAPGQAPTPGQVTVTIDDPTGAGFGGLAPTVTLHDVELCRVGQWNASTGGAPITRELMEAVIAARQDPQSDHVPVHLGHMDPRFPALSDGEPALGWVERLRITGQPGQESLVGDLADVPARWAAIIPKAFRRRSVELAKNLRTPAGRTHPYALVGLGLLGVQAPAVKGMSDIAARYSEAALAPQNSSEQNLQVLLLEDAPPAPPVTPPVTSPAQPASADAPSVAPSSTPGHAPARHDDPQSAHDSTFHPFTPITVTQPEEPPVPRQPHTDEQLRQMFNLAADADVTALRQAIVALPEAGDPAATPGQAQAGVPVAQGQPQGQFQGQPIPVPVPVQATQQYPQQVAQPVAVAQVPGQAPAGATTAVVTPTSQAAPGNNITAQATGARELVTASAGQPGQFVQQFAAAPAQQGQQGQPAGYYLSEQQMATITSVLHNQEETRRRGLIAAALSSGRLTVHESNDWDAALADPNTAAGAERMLGLLPAGRVPVTEVGSLGYANLSAHVPASEAAFDAFENGLGLGLNRGAAAASATAANTPGA